MIPKTYDVECVEAHAGNRRVKMTETEERWLDYARGPSSTVRNPIANSAKPWERLYLDMGVLTATR